MYNTLMTKFKWGNYKTAKYLDPESTTMFYPVITSTVLNLAQNLSLAGEKDKALKILHKYDQEMPDIYPYIDIARNKYYLVVNAYNLNDVVLANKYANSIDAYVTDQLEYNNSLLADHSDSVDPHTVQIGLYILKQLSDLARDNHQTAIADKLQNHFKDYETKFASLMGPAPKQ